MDGKHKSFLGDLEAQWGHRTSTTLNDDTIFYGYHAHIATSVPKIGGSESPELITGCAFTPANIHATKGAVLCSQAMAKAGVKIEYAVVDSGIAPNPDWADYQYESGFSSTMDYTKKSFDSYRPVAEGFILHAGLVFSTGMPKDLWTLERLPDSFSPNYARDFKPLVEKYAQREPWRATPVGGVKKLKNGCFSQRFRGSALTGKVRYPSVPRRLRKELGKVPASSGLNWGCGKTITVYSDVLKNTQKYHYGSCKWQQSMSRRSQVERINSRIKDTRGHQH